MKKTENKAKKGQRKIFAIIIFIIGLLIFLYPFISSTLSDRNQTIVINNYIKDMSSITQEEIKKKEEIVEKYNEQLATSTLDESGISYIDFLNLGEVLGYIEIPKIKVNLPIYHGISDDILRIGIGHLEKSSLPSQQATSHVVLTGHRGLPTSTLFTDLDKIEKNDEFSITALNKKYTYRVDQIKVVLPKAVEELAIVEGKNYTTLITCTPYMINTHRLLVRGELISVENIDYTNIEESDKKEDKTEIKDINLEMLLREIEYIYIPMIIYYVLTVIFVAWILYLIFFRRKEDENKETKNKEIKNSETQNKEAKNKVIKNKETQNKETKNKENKKKK